MGFLNSMMGAVSNASESAHGDRLQKEFDDSVRKLGNMDRSVADEVIRRFVLKRASIKGEMRNWSRDGKISMSGTLRRKAREAFDLNVVEGYALWMTSTWLECSVRMHASTRAVFLQLDGLATAHEAVPKASEARVLEVQAAAKKYLAEQAESRAIASAAFKRLLIVESLIERVKIVSSCIDIEELEKTPVPLVLFESISKVMDACLKRRQPCGWLTHGDATVERMSRVIAWSIGLAIANAEGNERDNAQEIGLAAKFLEAQGMVPSMISVFIASSLKQYFIQPRAGLGDMVQCGIEAMSRYLRSEDGELNIAFVYDIPLDK